MFSIYLPSKLLLRLAIHDPEKEYSSYDDKILDKILKRETKIHIYGDDAAQLINEMKDTATMAYPDSHCDAAFIYLRYIRNASCQIDDCSDIIKAIEKDNSEILKYNGALFLFDKSVNVDVKKIRNEYGILCQDADKIDMTELRDEPLLYLFDVEKTPTNNWMTILDNMKRLPSNFLCIADRYLFDGDNYYVDIDEDRIWRYDGIDNVLEIIECLRSKELKNKYQVYILICPDSLYKHKMNIGKILEKFKERMDEDLQDKVEINILAIKSEEYFGEKKDSNKRGKEVEYYNRLTHNRRLFTPYFYAEANNGICLIRRQSTSDNKDKSVYTQKVSINLLFSTGLKDCSCATTAAVIDNYCKDFISFLTFYQDNEEKRKNYQFMSSDGKTDLLKYLENNKIWLAEYAKE